VVIVFAMTPPADSNRTLIYLVQYAFAIEVRVSGFAADIMDEHCGELMYPRAKDKRERRDPVRQELHLDYNKLEFCRVVFIYSSDKLWIDSDLDSNCERKEDVPSH
jgi:hypothetical protein